MQQAEFSVLPYILTPHHSDRSFSGQDVIEMHPGELWMFTNWGQEPANFNPSDREYFGATILKSDDGGRAWHDGGLMEMPWGLDGSLHEGGRSVLRLHSGKVLFVGHRASTRLAKSGNHGVPAMSTSVDDGKTWSSARLLVEEDDIYYVMNQRLIQLRDGRLVLPVAGRDPLTPLEKYGEGRHPCQSMCFLSDDEGQTWRKSVGIVREPTERGAQEPCVAEIGPGRLLMLYRSGRGNHQVSYSEDGGETWSEPQDSGLIAACSPLALTKLPDGRLVVVYNHAKPLFPESYFPRNPLAYATSTDGEQTWSEPVAIDDQPGQQLIYPSITPIQEGLLVVYCAYYDAGDGSFSLPSDAWKRGGGKCCLMEYPA